MDDSSSEPSASSALETRPTTVSGNARSLRVQVVAYLNTFMQIRKLLEGILASVYLAEQRGSLSSCELFIGDSSPRPTLEPDVVAGLKELALANGISRFEWIHFGQNLGSAGGSNRLAEGAKTNALLILNPDTYPAPTMLHELLTSLTPGVGVVEAKQVPAEHPKAYDPVTGETSWASGACMMVARSIFEEVGGFDIENFFLHCDDVDFSWRVRLAGFKVLTVPRAIVFHDKRIDLKGKVESSPAEVYHGILGRLMLASKYGRPDLIDRTVAWVTENGQPEQRQALEEFQRLRKEARVPAQLTDAHRVAEFVGGSYAVHRF